MSNNTNCGSYTYYEMERDILTRKKTRMLKERAAASPEEREKIEKRFNPLIDALNKKIAAYKDSNKTEDQKATTDKTPPVEENSGEKEIVVEEEKKVEDIKSSTMIPDLSLKPDSDQNQFNQMPIQPIPGLVDFSNTIFNPRHKSEGLPNIPPKQKQTPKPSTGEDIEGELNITPLDTVNNDKKVSPTAMPVEKSETIPNPSEESTFIIDNSKCFAENQKKADLLKSIEEIANEMNCQVQFISIPAKDGKPSGLISVHTFVDRIYSPLKSFIIDLGVVIDRREKLWPINSGYVEDASSAYEVKISDKEKKKVINKKLFSDIFMGGIHALRPKDSMYTQDFIALNRLVALITVNNHSGIRDKETKTKLRERLIKAMNAGVFDAALRNDPKTRFRLEYFNSLNDYGFTSQGVPYRFTTTIYPDKVQNITFGNKVNLTIVQ